MADPAARGIQSGTAKPERKRTQTTSGRFSEILLMTPSGKTCFPSLVCRHNIVRLDRLPQQERVN
jgi:hypothetical protein